MGIFEKNFEQDFYFYNEKWMWSKKKNFSLEMGVNGGDFVVLFKSTLLEFKMLDLFCLKVKK